MTDKAAAARLRFLNTSARFYSTTAPETSAHLMLQCNTDPESNAKHLNRGEASTVCTACAAILVPGWTSRVTILNENQSQHPRSKTRSKKPEDGDASKKQRKYVRFDCLTCSRFEMMPLEDSKARRNNRMKNSKPQLTSSMEARSILAHSNSQQPPKPASTNASSKQRAKARKQGGLQAMLEKSKMTANPSSGFGLDLLDLMKQG
ncbi:hypothetical protein MMC28_001929 [Mycoblastus sanguinarius]|nr:hypothetical protein [Mycoblastus sanguinarius]